MGILIGTALSLILFIENLAQGHYEVIMPEEDQEACTAQALLPLKARSAVLIYAIKGKLIYINSVAHINRFESNFNEYSIIVLRLRDMYFIDLDGIDAFDEIVDIIQAKKQTVLVAGVNPSIKQHLVTSSSRFKMLQEQGLVFNKVTDALRYAGQLETT